MTPSNTDAAYVPQNPFPRVAKHMYAGAVYGEAAMFLALGRARPMIGVWAAATGLTALLLVMQLDNVSPLTGLTSPNVWIAMGASIVVAALCSPILTAAWMRWYWGALAGLPLGGLIMFGFFFVRPHAWQPSRLDAWKSVGMFVGLYPEIILASCVLTGALVGWMASRSTEVSPTAG